MDKHLVRGKPYFTDSQKRLRQFPYLTKDIACDVLIVGGGIDGVITAYNFVEEGVDTVVIDKSRIGFLSTSCATALLEYQLDEHAKALQKYLTKDEVITAYKLGLQSLDMLENIIKKTGNHCHYAKRPTLIFTQNKKESSELKEEFEFRKQNGLDAEFLTRENNTLSFEFESGIFCKNGGAEFNPYLFTKQLAEYSVRQGLRIYENTECVDITYRPNNVMVTTSFGNTINCKKIICATGYNTEIFSKKPLCELHTSYSVVTSKLPGFSWNSRALLHDNSDPYHYIRLLDGDRIIIGGEDLPFGKGIDDKKSEEVYKKLEEYIFTLFPEIADRAVIEYKFCGAFGTTLNNLSVIGPSRKNPQLLFMLGYGANGIVNSIIGSKMLTDFYKGIIHPALYLFSPNRKLF